MDFQKDQIERLQGNFEYFFGAFSVRSQGKKNETSGDCKEARGCSDDGGVTKRIEAMKKD